MFDKEEMKKFSTNVRRSVLQMIHDGKSAHVGSNLSAVDIVAVLYNGILRGDPARPQWTERDRFIMSKGHACACVYATLAMKGFFPMSDCSTYYQDGGLLPGHATTGIAGVEFSTGSLGHGLPVACGMALGAKRDRSPWRVFVLMSDGECDEGSNWEAILFAAHHRLDNLVAIVDYNRLQCLAPVGEVLELEPFMEKWRSFGWAAREVDGHDHSALFNALAGIPWEIGRPSCVIARTIRGKGVSFMEHSIDWYYRNVTDEILQKALKEL